MVKNSKFIIDIVPLTKIPLTTSQSFSYLFEKKICKGALVSIPLFKRNVEGIVIGSRDDFERLGNIELKKINSIILEDFLCEKQLELAQFISDYYISSLGVVMKNFVPKRIAIKKQVSVIKKYDRKNIVLTAEQKNAVKIITQRKDWKFLLHGPAGSGKTEVYINSILEIKKQDKNFQFLIIIPEKTLTPQALERYGAYFKSEEIGIISSNISKGQFYTTWQKIKSGEIKIIIGTRMAVFAPFKNLGLIVIDEEQDMSFKQWDMNPRYDARIVAEELAKMHQCKIVRGSATPSVESYWRTRTREMNLLILPSLKISGVKQGTSSTIIVDMKKERWVKNYTCISKKLKSEIEYALKYKQQIILLINRQGMSSFSICESCKAVLKCPSCDRALIYEKGGFYKCTHCDYKTSIFPKCDKCGGISFKNVGLGTQKVEKEVLNLFPSTKIIVADTASSKEHNFHEKIYTTFSKGEADILIGTQMISKGWDLPKVSLVGIIDTDNMLTFPDYTTEEKVFQLLVQVSGRVNRPGAIFPGVVIIQTFQPENRLIKTISEGNFEKFFENEIKEREALGFPPYGKIVRLIFQDYSQEKTENETLKAYELLKNIPKIKLTEPHIPLLSKIRGRFRKQMIIKICNNKISNSAKLKNELKKLGTGWIIDVDPISII